MRNVNRENRKARLRRHGRVRRKIWGTSETPRLCVFRSLNHIYAQIIDDVAGRTLVAAASLKVKVREEPEAAEEAKKAGPRSLKMRRSRAVGKAIAEMALTKGIKGVKFDRGGYIYHGRIAELADAAREAGLEF